MALKPQDLAYTVLKKVSLDEFQPKTGNDNEVAVVGFYTVQEFPGQDLYNFISGSVLDIRDVELSPNPNPDGYYMVFVEMNRNKQLLDNIQTLINDVSNIVGKLDWQIQTPYSEDLIPLGDKSLSDYVQTDPENFLTPTEFKEKLAQELEEQEVEENWATRAIGKVAFKGAYDAAVKMLHKEIEADGGKKHATHSVEYYADKLLRKLRGGNKLDARELATQYRNSTVLEFLQNSSLESAEFFDNNSIALTANGNHVNLYVEGFGDAEDVMSTLGINESAIEGMDNNLRTFNQMLGQLNAVKIDEYLVIFDTNTKQALVGKPC